MEKVYGDVVYDGIMEFGEVNVKEVDEEWKKKKKLKKKK